MTRPDERLTELPGRGFVVVQGFAALAALAALADLPGAWARGKASGCCAARSAAKRCRRANEPTHVQAQEFEAEVAMVLASKDLQNWPSTRSTSSEGSILV